MAVMDDRNRRLKLQAKVIKALSHATRLMVVEELAEAPCTVGELATAACCDISTMSRHLSILRNAGIVTDEKIANNVICHLAVPCVMQFFECVERIVNGDPDPCGEASCLIDPMKG